MNQFYLYSELLGERNLFETHLVDLFLHQGYFALPGVFPAAPDGAPPIEPLMFIADFGERCSVPNCHWGQVRDNVGASLRGVLDQLHDDLRQ